MNNSKTKRKTVNKKNTVKKKETEDVLQIASKDQENSKPVPNELEKDLTYLREKLGKSEKREEAFKIKISELEKINKNSQMQIEALQEKLSLAKQEPDEDKKVDYIDSAYSLFQIEIYPGDNDFRCKIKNIQTEDEQLFIGIDEKNIRNFIFTHLPKEEEIVITDTIAEESKPIQEGAPSASTLPMSHQVKTYHIDGVKATNTILPGKPFRVGLMTDVKGESQKTSAVLQSNISIYAKALEKGTTIFLGNAQRTLPFSGKSLLKIKCKGLPQGTYRLETAVNFNLSGQQKAPVENFTDYSYINVY